MNDNHDIAGLGLSGNFTDALRDAFGIKDERRHISVVRDLLKNQMALIRASNYKRDAGLATVGYITEMIDILIQVMWDQFEIEADPSDNMISIVAVGGYGRRELCPNSDIDLLILTSRKATASEKRQAETLVRSLWDYGYDAGTSVRSISQCTSAWHEEMETATSFLSERFIAGNDRLYRHFLKLLNKRFMPWHKKFLVGAVLAERDKRTAKFGGLIQLLEPNLKEGNGGLRDVHTIEWLAWLISGCRNRYDLVRKGLISPQDLTEMQKAYGFLLQVRCCLHFSINKKSDLLPFSVQPQIARELGFSNTDKQQAVEVFLQSFYRHTKAINRITETLLSGWKKPARFSRRSGEIRRHSIFKGEKGALKLKSAVGNPFRNNIRLMLEYFSLANAHGMAYGNFALLRIKQAVKAFDADNLDPISFIRELLDLCKRTERVGRMLRAMHDVGVIELIIPDFARLRFHTQHNIYHIYTTDEHTLTAVRQLAYLPGRKDRQLASLQDVLLKISDLDVLLLACFFHDIGKGLPGDHCETGSRLIEGYMEKTGFSLEQREEGRQLVLHHLAMNELAQRRDPEDPRTAFELVRKIKHPSTLQKLYLLTYCDISSVHPDAWSGWKSELLQMLFLKTMEVMKHPSGVSVTPEDLQTRMESGFFRGIDAEEVGRHLREMPHSYQTSTDSETIAAHLDMIRRLEGRSFIMSIIPRQTHLELTFVAPDSRYLLMMIAGCLAKARLSVLNAKIYTRADKTAIDEFSIVIPPELGASTQDLQSRLHVLFEKYFRMAAENFEKFSREIESALDAGFQRRPLHVPVGIEFSNSISEETSTVDVSCQDRIGLMYLVAKVFSDLGINIHGAILTTEAEVAMDAFYIKDLDDKKIEDQDRIAEIKKRLEEKLFQ